MVVTNEDLMCVNGLLERVEAEGDCTFNAGSKHGFTQVEVLNTLQFAYFKKFPTVPSARQRFVDERADLAKLLFFEQLRGDL